MQQWESQGLGIRWITLMLDNPNEGPPTTSGAQTWKDNFGLESIAVCADPTFSFVPGSSVGTPQFTLIDPRNMQVMDVQEGSNGTHSDLVAIANGNM